jgi:hypothetical protein
MSTLAIRKKLIGIADLDVGNVEVRPNEGPWIAKYWPATNAPEIYLENNWRVKPYCAAAMCYWLREWLKLPEVLAALKMTKAEAESWRCKSPGAWDWMDWAKRKGLQTFSDSPSTVIHLGDVVVYDFHHIGLVANDKDNLIYTIEANTNVAGSRDGDGCWRKDRRRKEAQMFIRLLP